MPRAEYIAAQRPAGPPPTMITSYALAPFDIGSEFQSRGISLPRQGAPQMRAKLNGLEFDRRMLRPRQLGERRRSHGDHAVAIATALVQQRRRGLNQALPDPPLAVLNNRTPNGFH